MENAMLRSDKRSPVRDKAETVNSLVQFSLVYARLIGYITSAGIPGTNICYPAIVY